MTIMAAVAMVDRSAEVWTRLESVIDPELDESVTELGFVTRVEVDADDHVRIDFRLPTYWCAANFAFLMADDMRVAVAALPWVTKVSVGLGEHMYADEINRGVAAGRSRIRSGTLPAASLPKCAGRSWSRHSREDRKLCSAT